MPPGSIGLGKCLIASFEFIRERNVLNLALLMEFKHGISHFLERFRASGAAVIDTGYAILPAPQVYSHNIIYMDKITAEAVAAFKQLGIFAVADLRIQMKCHAGHTAFVPFARTIHIEIAETTHR